MRCIASVYMAGGLCAGAGQGYSVPGCLPVRQRPVACRKKVPVHSSLKACRVECVVIAMRHGNAANMYWASSMPGGRELERFSWDLSGGLPSGVRCAERFCLGLHNAPWV